MHKKKKRKKSRILKFGGVRSKNKEGCKKFNPTGVTNN